MRKTNIAVTYLLHVARAIALGSKTFSHLIASSNHDLNKSKGSLYFKFIISNISLDFLYGTRKSKLQT